MKLNKMLNLKLKNDFHRIQEWFEVDGSVILRFNKPEDMKAIEKKLNDSKINFKFSSKTLMLIVTGVEEAEEEDCNCYGCGTMGYSCSKELLNA